MMLELTMHLIRLKVDTLSLYGTYLNFSEKYNNIMISIIHTELVSFIHNYYIKLVMMYSLNHLNREQICEMNFSLSL